MMVGICDTPKVRRRRQMRKARYTDSPCAVVSQMLGECSSYVSDKSVMNGHDSLHSI